MSLDDDARRLADDLSLVLDRAESADRSSAAGEALSAQEARALRTVDRLDCPIMSAIADAIRLSLSSCTGLIDRLCARNLVSRSRSDEDRRVVQVELTEEGRRLQAAARQGRVAFAKDLLEGLAAGERAQLVALLEKAAARFKVERAGA